MESIKRGILLYMMTFAFWGILYPQFSLVEESYETSNKNKNPREDFLEILNAEQAGVVKQVEMKGNDQQLMERVMKVVNERLCDADFNVEALADEVGLSRVQLHRRIKEITGITVGEFIRNLRLKQAAELLAKGDVTVSQVTYALGMSNPTHFTAAFKRYFGVTPTEYMKKHSGATNS